MSMFLNKDNYNPDILETIANLSNDEVFTPPKLANDILDMLPVKMWSNSKLRFLDPVVKTGIFLREITSKLIEGLADEIPDLQERVNHILTKQIFGVGITELTTLMSRRTVYCSTTANVEYYICTQFRNAEGNIKFPETEHTFDKNGRCKFCGANEENYSRGDVSENYAYSFIHDDFEEVFDNMKFDVIIGNPPYQLDDGGAMASSAPLYHKFIEKSIELKPKYISMIVPSRWFLGGKGLDKFREAMIKDTRIKNITHYQSSTDCFSEVLIGGGVNYFLWDKEYSGNCQIKNILTSGDINTTNRKLLYKDLDVFINDNILFNIVSKVQDKTVDTFDKYVSPRDPYHIISLDKITKNKVNDTDLTIYGHKIKDYTSKLNIGRNDYNYDNKLFISYAYGSGHDEVNQVINRPFIPEENAVCTGTYLSIGPFKNAEETNNVMSYMKTKFFRAIVYSLKKTQHGTRKVYNLVPDLDYSKPWTDAELYEKYKLTKEEIDYIEDNIKPMEDFNLEENYEDEAALDEE